MATLQKIRSRGPLLVIVIGLALFAFIASDAWKVAQPHQVQEAGIVNGDKLSAQDYQKMVEEYTDVVKTMRGVNSLTDEQAAQVRDEVWQSYVNNRLIETEAEKLGLKVSDAEIQDILRMGTHPLLLQTPFVNQQTGRFDKDMLNKFLVDYADLSKKGESAAYAEQYTGLYNFWAFIEKTLRQSRLAEKYQSLISKALISNPVEAQQSFDARSKQYNLVLATIPYAQVPDSAVTVKEADLKELYNKRKEQFKQYRETRDVKYIDVQVTASAEDRASIQKEVDEAAAQLTATTDDYAAVVRAAGSELTYVDLLIGREAFPADVATRLDSVGVGTVHTPYYNATDNTLNTFKVVSKGMGADSIRFRQIQVVAADPVRTKTLADSIYNALKGGADFAELAQRYGQTGEATWLTAAQYEGAQVDGDNLRFLSTLNQMSAGELKDLSLGQGQIILQVQDRRALKEKYKVAVVKREVAFSKETYNRAYNDFSQFIAANPTLEKLEANAEEAGYKLLEREDLYSSEHYIGGVRGTKEALRWLFEAKPGNVSGLYECGDSDHLMVVALAKVNPEGYRSLQDVQDVLRAELIKDKKAEKIMNDMKAANVTTLEACAAMNGAMTDSLKLVSFSAPAYVAALRSSEPLVGAYASVAAVDKVSAPIKGIAGVLLLKKYSEEPQTETMDAKNEENMLAAMHARLASRLINDLYLKAKVEDKRYLFF